MIDRELPLAEAAEAHRLIETRHFFGRFELDPASGLQRGRRLAVVRSRLGTRRLLLAEARRRERLYWAVVIVSMRRKLVLSEEATETVSALNPVLVGSRVEPNEGARRIRWAEVEGAVRPVPVGMIDIDTKHLLELAATENEDPIARRSHSDGSRRVPELLVLARRAEVSEERGGKSETTTFALLVDRQEQGKPALSIGESVSISGQTAAGTIQLHQRHHVLRSPPQDSVVPRS